MDFKTTLEEKLKTKGLTDSSIKLYLRNLEKLNDGLPLKNFKFLEKFEETLEKLNKYKPNTKRGYLISIVSTLGTEKENKKIAKLYAKYYDEMMKINNEIKAVPTDEMTKTQNENWIKLDEVKKVYEDLKADVEKFVNNKVISDNQYNKLLSLMVLSLYTLIVPRRNKDYMMMHIIRPYKEDAEDNMNYLDYDNKKFIFNVYKTAKTHNQKVEDIPEDLMNIINMYLKHHPAFKGKKLPKKFYEPFLVFKDGTAFSADNTITRILNKVFGKKISSSMLYHIYVSDKFGDTVNEMKKVASDRGHTVDMLKEYIKDDKNII